jgi:hypothetical protein
MNRFLLVNELVACVVWVGVVTALVGSVGCSRVSIDDAQATTKRFMDALRSKDAEALAQATSYPLAFRELGDYVNCKPTAAKSRAELPAAMACVFDDELLGQQLKAALGRRRRSTGVSRGRREQGQSHCDEVLAPPSFSPT